MSYSVYLGTMLLPVTPGKLTLKINNGNKTYCLMNEGEINALKAGINGNRIGAAASEYRISVCRI